MTTLAHLHLHLHLGLYQEGSHASLSEAGLYQEGSHASLSEEMVVPGRFAEQSVAVTSLMSVVHAASIALHCRAPVPNFGRYNYITDRPRGPSNFRDPKYKL